MPSKYFCAHCNEEFVPEHAENKPRCPKCMRRSGVESVQEAPSDRGSRRRWLLAGATAVVAAGIGYGVYQSTAVTLEEPPPVRPLEPRELSAYLEREQVDAGPYRSMFVLSGEIDGWPAGASEIAARMHRESSRWSLEHTLPREVLTAEETLASIEAQDERIKLYPLEMAVAMTALLRERGSRAMVAEAWELDGAEAPADPSGMLGYFVCAVYDGDDEVPSAFFDPWGTGGEVTPSGARVLRDTEVVAAALGTEATRIFAGSGDGAAALPMTEAAMSLDPVSPSIRVSHATVLAESGGLADGVRELQAATELRPDGPRQLNLAQLYLAQAGMLEMTGQQEAADAQLAEANRIVTEVVERWPRYGRAHLAIATIYLGLDDAPRARIELEEAESLSPDAPMLWAAWAQYHLAERDPISAMTKMKRAVEIDPHNWQLRLQAAHVFQRAGEDGAARASVAAALDLVASERRSKVREYVERMMGVDVSAPPAAAGGSEGPALMLGDPSNLRLRDPDQTLKLELDE
ncbi:MAG: hypothetical protein AMJ62_03005 [Myxococcales bacterium SG8_38]|nr:MAG: hypothetical protein AMJ62_03005 [Myxococcales bacterium SG8_38]